MAYLSLKQYTGDGSTTDFLFDLPYIKQADVHGYVSGVEVGISFADATTVRFDTAPTNGEPVVIRRQTDRENMRYTFPHRSYITNTKLDGNNVQLLYLDQEDQDLVEIAQATADGAVGYAEEWANKAEDSLVSAAAGGNEIDEYSSKHHALKSVASAAAALASETAAALSETNAAASEVAAAASAVSAQNAADSLIWNDVKFLSAVDSPYTVVAGDRGVLLAVDSSGGAVTINLPLISGLVAPWTVGVKKISDDGNIITVAANVADEIDGSAADKLIQAANVGATFIADTDTAPDTWTTMNFGGSTGNMVVDNYTDGVDFTAGTTTALTLSVAPGSENNVAISFDGIAQHHSQFTVSGTTVTFSSAIPLGVNEVEAITGTTLTIGVPSDNSVATAAIQDNAVTTVKIADANVTEAKLDASVVAKLNKDEIIYDSGELTVAATTIDITGLDLGKLETYEIVAHIENDSAGAVDIYLMNSEDTTVANYITQKTEMSGTTVSTSVVGDASICQLNVGRSIAIFGFVAMAQHFGYSWQTEGITYTGTGTKVEQYTGYSANLMTGNMTGMRLQASATDGLGVGSRFIIKRKV